jgi:hypothetical protein
MKPITVSSIASLPPSSAVEFSYSKARGVAKQTGVSSRTIHRWAEAKLISRRVINARVILYSVQEVQAFIEKARVA